MTDRSLALDRSSASALRLFVALGCAIIVPDCERAPLCPDVYADPQIPVPAINIAAAAAPMFAPINAMSTSSPSNTTVSIVSNQGTVGFGGRGPFPAFIFNRVPYPTAGSTVYGGLGVEEGTWFPFWLYCSSDGRLTGIDEEMSDRDVGVFEMVEGTCSDQNVAPMTAISIGAHTLSPIALTCGFSVSSPPDPNPIYLLGSYPGSMFFQGDSAIVFPFHAVDCRTGCGSPGWYELHAIMWDQVQQVVGFEVIYLSATGVTATNGILLPSGNLLEDDEFPGAVWSLDR